ncbi:hypothetical protein BJX63DRAFT_438061 [Aspergillus granulosus]|uniref:Uncharacterized protein n=1 Tax=Aspergillus granulosus TaxID=176169 RepID=A0ABR4GUS5_9EURO
MGRVGIHWAAERGYDEVVQEFLSSKGTDMDIEDGAADPDLGPNVTLLLLAAATGRDVIFHALLARSSVPVSASDLCRCVLKGANLAITKTVMEMQMRSGGKNLLLDGNALCLAAEGGSEEVLRYLLSFDQEEINYLSPQPPWLTVLHSAILSGRSGHVRAVLGHPRLDMDLITIKQQDMNLPTKNDVWGDFFLHPAARQDPTSTHPHVQTQQPRWPCSYEEAASVLSEATPVKVLLYRRITQLQTLIYRGASPSRLEEVIQKTLLVYHHWEYTYQPFMLDCVANHGSLPHRIQSWYVILDGHWHLAAMLLADVLESIDRSRFGLELERESRIASDLIATLRIDNALAVGSLARSSLRGQNSTMHRHFHDSLNEVAFLVEPWTVVLVHSFAKAAYISLDWLGSQGGALGECFRQNCEHCISALKYLGRKSDMAFCVASGLERELHKTIDGLY